VAWTAPRTWAIGQLVTASDLNEQLRDNLAHLKLLVDDDGKIPELSSSYLADLSGANLTDVLKTTGDNEFTDGVQDFSAGVGTRLVIPVGANRWAT